MSLSALNWAFHEPVTSSACKFVLVALADYANDMNHAYPSVQTICRKTSLERKTVILCLDKLVRSGHLRDTGKRMGGTNSILVYEVLVEQSQNRNYSVFDRGYPENGIDKLSQKRDTEPSSSLTVREPTFMSAVKKSPLCLNDEASEIYQAYPRKESKVESIKAITKHLKKHGKDFLLTATIRYAEQHKSTGTEMKFTPLAATWFNKERFLDIMESTPPDQQSHDDIPAECFQEETFEELMAERKKLNSQSF